MCVAAVIYNPLTLSDLKNMEDSNPDGAGVSWRDGNAIRFKRGLTAQEIFDLQEEGEVTYPYFVHFRWATYGDKVGALTHPFPLGMRALFGELDGTTDAVLMHNGSWSGWSSYLSDIPLPQDALTCQSDTAVAAYIARDNEDILDQVHWATAIMRMEGDDLKIHYRGSTWEEENGNWFSNMNWKPSAYPTWYSKHRDYKPTSQAVTFELYDAYLECKYPNNLTMTYADFCVAYQAGMAAATTAGQEEVSGDDTDTPEEKALWKEMLSRYGGKTAYDLWEHIQPLAFLGVDEACSFAETTDDPTIVNIMSNHYANAANAVCLA